MTRQKNTTALILMALCLMGASAVPVLILAAA